MRHGRDHYAVLGVTRDASGEEIKRAFRDLARRLHPDVAPPDAGDSFLEVVEAYHVLSHPSRRSLYDRLGLRRRAARPAPAVPPIELALEWYEAERGASKPVELTEQAPCDGCDGRSHERGVTPAVCVPCRGTGHLSAVTESATLRYLQVATCPACEGRGHEPLSACTTCGGSGGTTRQRTLRIRIPAGVADGDQLRVDGLEQRFLLRVGPRPRDSRLVLALSGAALLGALGLLLDLALR